MRRTLWIAILLTLIALAIGWSTRPDPIAVTVHIAQQGTVEATVANTRAGTVKACRRARLAPPAGGQVSVLSVRQGEIVEAGQLLMQFWNDDVVAQVRLAESELNAARARTGEVCLAAELAEREHARIRSLHTRQVVSDEALDRAQSEARVRRSGCVAAQAAEQSARDRISVARAALARTELRAPFDGIVAEITGEIGEFVTPSPPGIPMPPAVDLIERGCLLVSAPLDEVDAPAITPGMESRISLDAFPGMTFPGRVKRIAPYVQDYERQARILEVEVEFTPVPAEIGLLPGYSADAEIVLARKENVLRIPSEALMDGRRLYVVEGDRLVLREVTVGLANWAWTEVRSGLIVGEQVVTSLGMSGLAEGVAVQVNIATR